MIKVIIALTWLLIVANLFVALPAMLVLPLKVLGVALIVAHLIEFFVFRDKIKAQGDGALMSFINTMLFGVVYFGTKRPAPK